MRATGTAWGSWLLTSVFALTACDRARPTTPTRPPTAASPTIATAEPTEPAEPTSVDEPDEPIAERRESRADGRHELRWLWTPGTVRRYALQTQGVSDGTTETRDRRVWALEVVEVAPEGGATLKATLAEHRFHWTLPDAPHEVAFDSEDPAFAKNIDDPIMRAATLAVGLELDVKVDAAGAIVELTGVERLDTRLDEEAAAHPDVFADSDDVGMARLMLGMSYNANGFISQLEGLLRTHTLPPSAVATGDQWTRSQVMPVPMVGAMELTFEQIAGAVSREPKQDECLRYDTTAKWSKPPAKSGTVTIESFSGTSAGWTCFSHRGGEVVAGGWTASFDIAVTVGETTVDKSERLVSELVLLR